jgi:uncharacterized protein YgiB involved in biofilm formation
MAMKVMILLFIVGVAAVMGWFALRGECQGGQIVTSEAQCRQSASLDANVCAEVFRRAPELIRNAATIFTDRERCLQQYAACVPHANNAAFTPQPHGFCVVASGGAISRQEPVYRLANAQRVGG